MPRTGGQVRSIRLVAELTNPKGWGESPTRQGATEAEGDDREPRAAGEAGEFVKKFCNTKVIKKSVFGVDNRTPL